jgi:hypothetical protein
LATITEGSTILLKRGMTYDLSGTVISKSVNIMSAMGMGDPAILDMGGSSLDITDSTDIASLYFKDLEIRGDIGSGYLMNFSTQGSIGEFKLDHVNIHDLRGVVRFKNSDTKTMNNFIIENSMVHAIGSYGVLTMDDNNAHCENVVFSKSTFNDVFQFFRWRDAVNAKGIDITDCTINDTPYEGGGDIIRVSNATDLPLNFSNTVFGKSTATRLVNGSGVLINMTNSYATADCGFGASTDLTTAPTVLTDSAHVLFRDILAGNLTLGKDFEANKSVGDPRWYYKPLSIDLTVVDDANALKDTLSSNYEEGVTILLKRGMIYDLSGTAISKSVNIMSAMGMGDPAILDLGGSSLDITDSTDITSLYFKDLEIRGDIGSGYLMNFSTQGSIGEFKLDHVNIHDLRGVVRFKNSDTKTMGNFVIENSIVHAIGSYGVLTMDDNNAHCNNVTFTKSTFNNVYQFYRWRDAVGVESVEISHCTIYDTPYEGGGDIIRVSGATDLPLNISNTIFGKSSKTRVVNGSGVLVNATDSYATLDCGFGTSTDFVSAPTALGVLSSMIFQDPANGNFRITDPALNGVELGDPRWKYVSTRRVAYVQKSGFVSAEGASVSTNDPVIRMLQADENFEVTIIETDGAGTDLDLSGYDLVIAQETFGSGDAIWQAGGALNLRNGVPMIYNKTWTLRGGKAITDSDAKVDRVADVAVTVNPANQGNPLFNGIAFKANKIKLYNNPANDDGAEGVNGIDVLNKLDLSDKSTLLASASSVEHPDSAIVINDIPAGTQFGENPEDVSGARMIAVGFNYGPIIKGDGANITSAALTIWRNAAYILTGQTPPTEMYMNPDYMIPPRNVAYVQKADFVTVEGAATSTTDPVIQMLKADPLFNVTVMEVSSDTTSLDFSDYDLIIAQETFGSGDNIWKSTGPLGIRNISAPVIYNKTWVLRNGRGISSANASISATANLSVDVDPAVQSHSLFNGVEFVNNKLSLFFTTATQDGSEGVNSIDALNRLELSSKGTLLASVPEGNDPDSSIVINHIPAGTQFGTDAADVLSHDMVALSFNYGAMVKDQGTNMTDAGLTIWRNAAYMLTGLTPPNDPVGEGYLPNDSTLADLTVNGETISGFSPQVFEYEITLPRGTTEYPTVEAFSTHPNAAVEITNATSLPGTTEVKVTSSDQSAMATYVMNFEVSLYPPTWTIIPSGDNIASYFDAAAIQGDTLVLVDGGVYEFNTARTGGKEIVLMSVPNPITRPTVLAKVIEMNGVGDGLVVRGIDFGPFSPSADYFVNFTDAMKEAKRLIVDDVKIEGFGRSIIRGNRAKQSIETVIFNNVVASFDPVNLDDEGYSMFFFDDDCDVSHFELTNSTFKGGHHIFLDLQTANKKEVVIDHCTFDGVNATQAARAGDFVKILNSAAESKFDFTNNIVTGLLNQVAPLLDSIQTFNIDDAVIDVRKNNAHFNNATKEDNVWTTDENYTEVDPQYFDGANGDLTVQNDALYTLGTDGGFIGDPRWDKDRASSDAFLIDLTVDASTVDGFSIGKFEYQVLLSPGTTTVPTVDATKRDENATVVITQAPDVNGDATVVITAEDGTIRTYTVHFTVADGPLDATLLKDLIVDATSVTGFDPLVFEYDVVLDPGTTTIPTVAAVAYYSTDTTTVTIVQADSTYGASTAMVESIFTNPVSKFYTINFSVAISTDATVSEITVNGSAIALEAGITSYTIGIEGTTVPTVTATPTFAAATVAITNPETAPGTQTSILVTAEDGNTTKTYLLNWIEAKGTDATLSDLKVEGATIAGFSSTTFSYNYETSTLEVPGIIATTTDPAASVVVSYPAALSNDGAVDATVVVTAEDGVTTNTYTVSITSSFVILGLGDLESNIYPNPFVNELNIVSRDRFNKIKVYDINGKEVMSKGMSSTNKYILDVSRLAQGLYNVSIHTTNGNVKTLRVLK